MDFHHLNQQHQPANAFFWIFPYTLMSYDVAYFATFKRSDAVRCDEKRFILDCVSRDRESLLVGNGWLACISPAYCAEL